MALKPTISKTAPPTSEAQSHKPTFGPASEKPGTDKTEPALDRSTQAGKPHHTAIKEQKAEKEKHQTTAKHAEDHSDISPHARKTLEDLEEEQRISNLNNPDARQKDDFHPTTEGLLSAPTRRPSTIDPMTGKAHYVGDEAPLPGGTIAHESNNA